MTEGIGRRRLLALAATLPTAAPSWSQSPDVTALSLIELPGGIEAPDFTLPDLSGRTHQLAGHRGRPVLVAFWAVWCPPCRRELAALADLRARVVGDGIEVLAVNLGDRPDLVANFLAAHPAPGLPVLMDSERAVAARFHVQGLPVAFAIDRAGVLRLGALGERDWRATGIEAQLRSLL